MSRLLLGFVLAGLAAAAIAVAAVPGGQAPATRAIGPVDSPLPFPPVLTHRAAALQREVDARAQRDEQAAAKREEQAAAKRAARAPEPAPVTTQSQLDDLDLPAAPDPKGDPSIVAAEVLDNGIALPPFDAPAEVRAIIEAGNQIARTPYKWGGGHGKWQDNGYDCSGSVSYALASAGLLGGPLDSGRLMHWGAPGKGKWITVWSSPGHVFLEVAGVRFDTSGTRSTGSRWQAAMRSRSGFVARHPPGL